MTYLFASISSRSQNKPAATRTSVPSAFLLSLLLMLFSIPETNAVEPDQIQGFHTEEESRRVNPVIRVSGDGRKMVYIVRERNFDTSLEGWLNALKEDWSANDASRVYLYDLGTGERTLLYTGQFSTASVNNATVLQSLEGGFSVDINRDGSRVALAYSSTSMNQARDRLSNSLKISVINTATLSVSDIVSVALPGYSATAVPLKMSTDGSRAVFAFEPAMETTATVYGVKWQEASNKPKLMSVKLQPGNQPVELSDPDWGETGSETSLIGSIGSAYTGFFDISANGNQVVLHNTGTGILYAVPADGGTRRVLAELPPGRSGYVAISGDGARVAFADRTDFTETVLYQIPYAGGERVEITRSNTYFAGNLKFNASGSHLLYQDTLADPGGSFGYPGTSRIISIAGDTSVSVGKDIADASENLNMVITTVSGWQGALSVFKAAVTQFNPDIPDDIYTGAFNGTKPDPSLSIPVNNIGVISTHNWRIYSCIRVLQNGEPAVHEGMDRLDLTLEITSMDAGSVRVLAARQFNANGEHNADGMLPDCSGSFDLATNQYVDIIKLDNETYQTMFELVNGDTLELVLRSAERM